jgi:hypothetical protein
MKVSFSIFLLLFCSLSFSQLIRYADSTTSFPKAKITKVSWLEGNWKSGGKTLNIQESWVRSGNNSMMAVANVYERAKIIFFEICTITEEEGSLVLRIRHFDAQLKAWEEKEKPREFRLVAMEKNFIYFDGYTFENVDKGHMTLHIQSKNDQEKLTIPYVKN